MEQGDTIFIPIIQKTARVYGSFRRPHLFEIKDKETWLTSGTLDMSIAEEDWLETKILNIDYKDVKKVSINHLNKKNESLSLTKDDKNENFLIDKLTKEQIPKSDLIANFIGYLFTNLTFEDVIEREGNVDNKVIIKINFEMLNSFQCNIDI